MRQRSRRALAAAAAVLSPVLAGCGASHQVAASPPLTSVAAHGPSIVSVQVGSHGCASSATHLRAGPAIFKVHVQDANTVSEVELLQRPIILAELESLTATRSERSFSLELPPGRIVLYCPGHTSTRTVLTVTGKPAAAMSPQATAAVERYRTWVEAQSQRLVNATLTFTGALDSGNRAQAEALYPAARVYYERVEPIAESFSTLDKEIDARYGDVPPAHWTGFHPIEQDLWIRHTTKGTRPLADGLVADVTAVNGVATRLQLRPSQIANGAVELLNEVSRSKITGEEERYSHLDLVDFQANVDGAQAAFDAVRPLLPRPYAPLGRQITARFADVDAALRHYRRNGTFVRYTALRPVDTRTLSAVVDALAEPLSRVSSIVLAQS